MNRNDFIIKVSGSLKIIRAQKNLTQEKMSDMLGISKKTLVEIEKGKILASWPVCVATAIIFESTLAIEHILGNDVNESIRSLSNLTSHHQPIKTLGGKIWWENILTNSQYKMQRNIISGHFRILDAFDCRLISSFDEKIIKDRFISLSKENNNEKNN